MALPSEVGQWVCESTSPSAVPATASGIPISIVPCRQLSKTQLWEKLPSLLPAHQKPVPTGCGHERLERAVLAVHVEVVRVEPVAVDLHPVRREAGVARCRDRVGGEPVGVAVEVVVRHADRVAHRARVAHRRAVQVAPADRAVVAPLGVEALLAELARLRRGARVDDRVARAEAVAVLHHVVIGGEAQVAVVGVPEELHAVEQDAVGLLGVEAVLARAAHEEVAADEPVRAVRAQDDVLRPAGAVGLLRRRHSAAGDPRRARGGSIGFL